jgi:hypothetical protein
MRALTRLVIAAAGVACGCAWPALGEAAPLTGPPFGYALSATGFNSYFVYDTKPGQPIHGSLQVRSLTSADKTILLSPVDVTTAAAGGLQYGDGSPSGEGRWLSLALGRVQLGGSKSASVPFTVNVPPDASPGEHFLGIVALDRRVLGQPASGHGSIRLRLIPRLAMTVELRLPGVRPSGLRVGSARIEIAPSGAALAISISNPGNKLVSSASGSVTVSQGSTALFSRGIELGAFVPGTSIGYRVPWEGMPVEGTYDVSGDLRPAGGQPIHFNRTVTFARHAIQQYRQDTGRSARVSSGTSGLLFVALGFAVAVAVVFAVAYMRAKRAIARGS